MKTQILILTVALVAFFATGCLPAEPGEPCMFSNQCGDGFVCDQNDFICVYEPPADCNCTRSDTNYSASPTYSSSASNTLKSAGQACSYNGECGGTLTCRNWVCADRAHSGTSCDDNEDCWSGVCVDAHLRGYCK